MATSRSLHSAAPTRCTMATPGTLDVRSSTLGKLYEAAYGQVGRVPNRSLVARCGRGGGVRHALRPCGITSKLFDRIDEIR